MLSDLRYALRSLRNHPGYTLAAVITLALGIGANTTTFSAVNAVLLQPLPLGNPDRLLMLWEENAEKGVSRGLVAPANVYAWREQVDAFRTSRPTGPAWRRWRATPCRR